MFFVAIRKQQLEALSDRPVLVPFFTLLTVCPQTHSVSLVEHIFTHNMHFRGPVTSNPASHSGRPPIKSQPDEQLPNRYFVLFVRLSQQNPTQYLKLHHCDCFLHMLSYSLFTKHRTIQHYKAWATNSSRIFQPLWARASSLSRLHDHTQTQDSLWTPLDEW